MNRMYKRGSESVGYSKLEQSDKRWIGGVISSGSQNSWRENTPEEEQQNQNIE